jgi:hypothetical protein
MAETCAQDTRRRRLRQDLRLNGLDEVEVLGNRRTLLVRFFHDAPEGIGAANLRITGGVVARHIQIVDVIPIASDDPDVPSRIEVALDRMGDGSIYHLHLRGLENIDPRYASAPFLFFPEADDGLDCSGAAAPTESTSPPPPIDYLAKDYPGFRKLMLDRLQVTLSGWQESHIPDIGVMLVELLAYVGDRLSYYQDAVATEAYLATARRRVSVRRHARLIDYRVHEGCNARALVQIEPDDSALAISRSGLTLLIAGQDQSLQFQPMPHPDDQLRLRQAHAAMRVHCWGDSACILLKGAVSMTLVDAEPETDASLRPGDFLVLEVMVVGDDGEPASDFDSQTRHPVRLTHVARRRDALLDKDLLEVSWSREDALPADFPLGSLPGEPVTVVRGNLVLVDQGRSVIEGDRAGGALLAPTIGPGRRRSLRLAYPGLNFAEPAPEGASARRILTQRDPREAAPMIDSLRSWPADGDEADAAAIWKIRPDLIESGPDDPHATVEVENDGSAVLRFGDGVCGRDPDGQLFEIVYRVGDGQGGNVGADRITRVQDAQGQPLPIRWARNPLPASGGVAPEDIEQVRLLAPHAFKDTQMRAITAEDYAALAMRLEPSLQRATAILVPTGGRQLARIALDPLGGDRPDETLLRRVATALEPYRRVGHDIEVVAGEYAPLLLVLRVELLDGYAQRHLRAALRAVLGAGTLPVGRLGAFHPDNLTFGSAIYGSRLISAALALDGVRAVTIVELARQFDRERGGYFRGVLQMAWNEIPQLDNDPLRPDKGRLVLQLVGGVA